ncbi:MAG: cobalt-precorrin-5B (C(1))-methyltransferase CbiD [Clostridiales bacterium]|nr:cobalt-precorrin-5B (C(1))-methyltransferase CbiD [Clostridiales bacterium]
MNAQRFVDQRMLRCGYTTGICAAAAAKAAARMLLLGEDPLSVSICTAHGAPLTLPVLDKKLDNGVAICAVQKDSGDDPDITDGVLVYAALRRAHAGISIDGGKGVGRVSKPGLDQPVGEAAINSAPRRMIKQALEEIILSSGYVGGLAVEISIPAGVALAEHTFNSRLGIVGGLSVLGTSGIVEPMSEAALLDTIRAELSVLAAAGKHAVLFTPGNYGEDFCRHKLGLGLNEHIKCGNFIGASVAAAVERGFKRILLVGHIGKLVKLGIGSTNTHSRHGDGRLETLLACALAVGAELPLLRELAACLTTDAALSLLREYGLLQAAMEELGSRIGYHLRAWAPPDVEIGFICFSNAPEPDMLCRSANALDLADIWRVY